MHAADDLTIHNNVADPALSAVAAAFCTGKFELPAYYVQQSIVSVAYHPVLPAIDIQKI